MARTATTSALLLALIIISLAGAPRSRAGAAPVSAASGGGDQPPIDGDLKLDVSTKLFLPWGNSSSAVEGSSYAVGASVAHVALGPCVYRALHWHAAAWEVFTLVHGEGPVRSLMIAPGAGSQQVRRDTLRRGDSVAYPAGWVHYQLNDGCKNATALLVWNAVHSGGVNNALQQIDALPSGYKDSAFALGRGPRQGFWLRDAECARRCGLDGGGAQVGEAGQRRALDPALAA